MESNPSLTGESINYVLEGKQELSVGVCGIIQPEEVIVLSLGSSVEISYSIDSGSSNTRPLTDESDATQSSVKKLLKPLIWSTKAPMPSTKMFKVTFPFISTPSIPIYNQDGPLSMMNNKVTYASSMKIDF